MEMDERKIKILQAIINDYINTAEPVGSRTIAKKYDLGISSATIRNEMADLEEMGYIEHLHSSSGRKPSNKGYRLYVDKLMQVSSLTPEEQYKIKTQILDIALFEVDKIIKQTTLILSELTKLTCIVKTPSMSKSFIRHIQFINIDSNNVLLLIITDSGIIKNNVIRVGRNVGSDVLSKLSGILNSRLRNLNCEQINLQVINNLRIDLNCCLRCYVIYIDYNDYGNSSITPDTRYGEINFCTMMIMGLAFIGILTASLASWLINKSKKPAVDREDSRLKDIESSVNDLTHEIRELKELIKNGK